MDILLVEDSAADIYLLKELMSEGQIDKRLHVVTDGVNALRFLRRESPYEDSVTPALILLDLNLPRKNGFEVLTAIKNDPDLKKIPVMILSSSSATRDIEKSYGLHANCFVTKPLDLDDFAHIVGRIEDFWFRIVQLPPQDSTLAHV